MRFEFTTATRIVFGPGTLRQVGPMAADMGRRALVVTGRTIDHAGSLLDALTAQGIDSV
jgi:alcohol dehydrogenase class IV